MQPFAKLEKNFVPYNLKVSTKANMVDQKRGLIELKPGYHVITNVMPKLVDTSKSFEGFDVATRKCKFSYEKEELKILKNYSKDGCEFECSLGSALAQCKCLPWYYPNNFTGTPMCDMFGGKCFDMIMSDESNYKKCSQRCIEDCAGTSYVAIASYVPLDTKTICRQPLFIKHLETIHQLHFPVNWFEQLTKGKKRPTSNEFCQDYVQNYIAIVTVETPTDTVMKSMRVKRNTLSEQLGVIGGTLGLFCGISILSMVEVMCFCIKMNKRICVAVKKQICKNPCKKKQTDVQITEDDDVAFKSEIQFPG